MRKGMDIDTLKAFVTKARQVLEDHHMEISPTFFGNFPSAACGNTSDLLSRWLQSNGFEGVKRVFGKRGQVSHGWLEWNGIIIDITSDQFEDGLGAVYIGTDRTFHDTFLNQRYSEPGIAPAIGWIYGKFSNLMDNETE